MTAKPSPIVDIHTHIYPPSYLSLLRSRTTVPYLLDLPDKTAPPRLIILPSDDDPSLPPETRGRPVDASYSSITEKLKFMTQHSISTSIISLANPWLDFLPPNEAPHWALTINNDLSQICHQYPNQIYAFATLPLSAPPPAIIHELHRLPTLPHILGIILSTTGLGSGLDDPNLDPIWSVLENQQTLIFLHPHYGLPSSVFGPRANEYGHVLPLSLGFPLETTIAFTRMFLSGVFDRYPRLRILIAHAGGAVPYLSGRIDSCIQHERHFPENETGKRGPRRGLHDVLRTNVWLDAVVYSSTSVNAAVDLVGRERVLFGTDHPFFPPLEEGKGEWESVRTNKDAIREHQDQDGMIMGKNAVRLLVLRCLILDK